MTINIGLVGTGGYAREVMPLLHRSIADQLVFTKDVNIFFVDVETSAPIRGIPVISEYEFLALQGITYFNIAIADSKVRERIASKYESHGCKPLTIQSHMHVSLAGNGIGEGAIFSPFSCVTADASIGRYFHCNIYSYVAHDCVIGDFVTFAPKVCCNGNVVIEDHAYIGTGAVIKQGTADNPIVIGRGAVVGMGAVVTKSVPPGAVVVGNPAKAMVR